MKKIICSVLIFSILIFFSACAGTEQLSVEMPSPAQTESNTTVQVDESSEIASAQIDETAEATSVPVNEDVESDELPGVYFAPFQASSIEEYYNSSNERSSLPDCYVFKNKPEGAEISRVTYREGVYVTVGYSIPLDKKYKEEDIDEYQKERMTSFICQRYLFEDGNYAFKVNVSDNIDRMNDPKIEVNGNEYYYYEEHSLYDPDTVIGYSVNCLVDGQFFYLHLPPLDTFENMTEYLEVVKAEPESGDSISADN